MNNLFSETVSYKAVLPHDPNFILKHTVYALKGWRSPVFKKTVSVWWGYQSLFISVACVFTAELLELRKML